MKTKNKSNKNMFKNIFKVIFFPVYLFRLLYAFIREKIAYSIRLKLSLRYTGILLRTVLGAGLIVILVYGGFRIQETVKQDYLEIQKMLSTDSSGFSELETYCREHQIPLRIDESNQQTLMATDQNLREYGSEYWLGLAKDQGNIYVSVNRDFEIAGTSGRMIIFSNIQDEITDILFIARIMLFVFVPFLFLALIAIAVSGKGIFEPIREMTRTVKVISEQNLNLRLNVSGSKNELKELALTFNEMMNRLEDQYNRQKQFVSDASHELRTPIAVIQGYAVMLDRWGKNDQAVLQESITAIKNEAGNMQELIDKLLFLARHDNSTLAYQKEEFSLTEMLQEVIRETQIIDSGHQINDELNQEISMFGDRNLMKQACRIFMDNAMKYTPTGGQITVCLSKEGESIAISIKDTGAGMTNEELKHIFDRFYRSDQSRTKERGGYGLGLAIAKIIILGHNGRITVRSKVGEGSEFIILLS
ncbi:MAG: ATP-binding protein [Dehalobacter sp.]|nr:ATP-binding protein [Dehalobacter sp.]